MSGRIVVCGYMVRFPLAGNVMAYFQYVLGLRRLGYDVLYVEESGWPWSSYDHERREWCDWPAAGLRVSRELGRRHCPDVPIVFVDRESGRIDGMSRDDLKARIIDCDLVLNVGGVCWLDEFEASRSRALVDMDPLFGQVSGFAAGTLDRYDSHFSYGVNIGRPRCTVPAGGADWQPTVPPVVVDLWDSGPCPPGASLTTIANWSAYGCVDVDGTTYGQKDGEFLRLGELPRRAPIPLEMAVSGVNETTAATLRGFGWTLRDAGAVSGSVASYRKYVAGSCGEFSVAKHAYVATHSGWFSDRSASYLAAGRPVIVQETGFSDWLPANDAVLPFHDAGSAIERIGRLATDYEVCASAARSVAGQVFGHDVVLPSLVERALAAG